MTHDLSRDPFRLDGQTVLITGAGGSIGQALVTAFVAAGARVIGADRDANLMAGLDLVDTLIFDQADTSATRAAVTEFLAHNHVPDVVIANAGFTRAEHFGHLDADSQIWDRELDINLNGVYAATDPLIAAMAKRGQGSLVFVSSVNGLMHFGNPAYSAAKAGLIAYSKAVAVERGRDGVRANVVCPGSVRTLAWDHRLAANPRVLDAVLPHYPLGRLVTPQEVANAVRYLASPAAAGVTGAVLAVDAGLTAGNLRFVDEVLRPS
jgi:NAD(P)-dependent dehydrogenase (short-subunit alcohol dehydrogenase family)